MDICDEKRGTKHASQNISNLEIEYQCNEYKLLIDINEFDTYLMDVLISLTVLNWINPTHTIVYSVTHAAIDATIILITLSVPALFLKDNKLYLFYIFIKWYRI